MHSEITALGVIADTRRGCSTNYVLATGWDKSIRIWQDSGEYESVSPLNHYAVFVKASALFSFHCIDIIVLYRLLSCPDRSTDDRIVFVIII